MYLGIDFGTSGVRAVVVDGAGQQLFEQATRFSTGEETQLLPTWEASLLELIWQIPAELRSHLQRIAIDGTAATALLCDTQGHPLAPPLMYNDHRGQGWLSYLSEIAPVGHPVLSATSSLVKLLWFSHQSEFAQARFFLHQADWLGFLLHGQLGISDYHNCLKLGYDPASLTYPSWFQDSRLQPLLSLLPQVLAPGTNIAPIQAEIAAKLHLPPSCQVCAGTTDSMAAFLASGVHHPGVGVTSLGSTLVLKLLSQRRIDDNAYGIYSHRLGQSWLVGGASNAGGAILRHYFTDAELVNFSQKIDPQRVSPLDYYPLLKPGERFPIHDPHLQPRLTPQPEDRIAFLHGLLESLSRIEAQGYQRLIERGALPLTQVLTSGGGAENSTWMAIRQRYLGVPVARAPHTEAAYGAALLARSGGRNNLQLPS